MDSLIGVEHADYVENLLNGGPEPTAATSSNGVLMGALVTATSHGRARSIERVERCVRLRPTGAQSDDP
jgi:hypothetical protein